MISNYASTKFARSCLFIDSTHWWWLFFYHFLLDFWVWIIFSNEFLNFYWICYHIASVLCFGFFWPWAMWGLSSSIRDRTYTPCIERWSLNHWITRDVPLLYFVDHLVYSGLLQPELRSCIISWSNSNFLVSITTNNTTHFFALGVPASVILLPCLLDLGKEKICNHSFIHWT